MSKDATDAWADCALIWLHEFFRESMGPEHASRASGVMSCIQAIEQLKRKRFKWIPMTEREPTKQDGDKHGYVFVHYHPQPGVTVEHGTMLYFHATNNRGLLLAWAPIPEFEQSRADKDEGLWLNSDVYRETYSKLHSTDHCLSAAKEGFLAGLETGRDDT